MAVVRKASDGAAAGSLRLQNLLLDHLRRIDAHYWPGADGLTVTVALENYPEAAAAGHVPGLSEMASRYPELRQELEKLFGRAKILASRAPAAHSGVICASAAPCRLD